LAYAALRKGEIGRLADVFGALAGYCQGSFEQLYPTREGAKLAALRWLSEARFTSLCPKVEASAGDAGHVARLKDALSAKLRPALEKRFSSGGAPFPLLLYKRVLEWEKSLEAARGVAELSDGGDLGSAVAESRPVIYGAADRPGKPPPNNGEQYVSQKKALNDGAGNGGGAGGNPADIVVVKFTRGEVQEIFHCINKMETILRKFA
jgi:hypothetical protein